MELAVGKRDLDDATLVFLTLEAVQRAGRLARVVLVVLDAERTCQVHVGLVVLDTEAQVAVVVDVPLAAQTVVLHIGIGVLAAVFAAALCWLLGTHVWAIQTEIAPAIDETAVMQQLSEMGVRIGMPIKKLNTRQIRWKMMQLQPNITFFSLNLRGNSLTVVAYGSTDPPEVLDEHAITKVVAARDGVVTQVRALEGQPMVRAGDAVQTGDTLISGLFRQQQHHLLIVANLAAHHSHQLTAQLWQLQGQGSPPAA